MAALLDLTPEELNCIYEYTMTYLGAVDVDVPMTKKEIQTLACRALKDYMYEINTWTIRNNFANVVGLPGAAATNFTNKFILDNQMLAQRLSDWFAAMARVGGKIGWKKDYIKLQAGKQIYDLAVDSGTPYTPGTRRIHTVMWYAKPEMVGTGFNGDFFTGNLFAFDFQGGLSYGGNTLSYLGNIFDAVLIMQSLELRNKVLRSPFYYNISGDIVELTPLPGGSQAGITIPDNAYVFYYYFDEADFTGLNSTEQSETNELISNPTQVKLDVLPYSKLNSTAKNWIDNYIVALAKYALASKFRMIRAIASPTSEYTVEFDFQSFLQEAKEERDALKDQIRLELEKLDNDKMLERKASAQQSANQINKSSPRKWILD